MAGTRADVIIGGVKAKLIRGDGSYKRSTIRREIQNNLLSQSESPALRNREDGVSLYQTSWAGGARWWKPLITQSDLSSYYQSNHMDTWSEPGKVVPGNKHTDAASTALHDAAIMATDGANVYAIGNTNTTNSDGRDVYRWDAATEAWVRETTFYSGIQDDSTPVDMVYDPSDGYFYVLAATAAGAREIGRFDPVTPDTDLSWHTSPFIPTYGSSIVSTQYGLVYYGGGTVKTIDKTGPSETTIFSLGSNATELLSRGAATDKVTQSPLLVNTPQGIYLGRNVTDGANPVGHIYRIDRDASGQFIGSPIATLPVGTVILGLQFHLGQLLISTTPDWRDLEDGAEDLEVVVYFVGEGGMGALGSIRGSREALDETPYRFLGADGERVFMAGAKRMWVFDAIRGGMHTAWEWDTASTGGPYNAMARAQDSDGDEIMLFIARDRTNYTKTPDVDDPDTVSAFGDDETHYVLESNFFDGGLPMEQKEITRVAILRDKDDGGSEWTVQISADDGAFTDALVSAKTGVYDEAIVSGTTGYQFRYRLIYQTKDTARKALRALLVDMTSGDMVTEWDLILDGDELYFDNKKQNEEEFYDNMLTLAQTKAVTTLIDNMQEQAQSTSASATGTKVKVIAVEISKAKPGESQVRIVLREAG